MQQITENKIFKLAQVLVDGLILLMIGLSLIVIFKKQKCILPLLIYFCGVISRLVMVVSPTVLVSGERTSTFLYLSFIFLEILLLKNMEEKKWVNSKKSIQK